MVIVVCNVQVLYLTSCTTLFIWRCNHSLDPWCLVLRRLTPVDILLISSICYKGYQTTLFLKIVRSTVYMFVCFCALLLACEWRALL